MPLDREQITAALRQCYDPEIPVNIVDLGLIYDVQNDPQGNVTVKMTLTSQGCPSAQAIPEQVRQVSCSRQLHGSLVWSIRM